MRFRRTGAENFAGILTKGPQLFVFLVNIGEPQIVIAMPSATRARIVLALWRDRLQFTSRQLIWATLFPNLLKPVFDISH
jgi:hypothetical protein